MKTPNIRVDFTVTEGSLARHRQLAVQDSSARLREPPDGMADVRCRLIINDDGVATWEHIADKPGHLARVPTTSETCRLFGSEIRAMGLSRLADLALERTRASVQGDTTVLDLGRV